MRGREGCELKVAMSSRRDPAILAGRVQQDESPVSADSGLNPSHQQLKVEVGREFFDVCDFKIDGE